MSNWKFYQGDLIVHKATGEKVVVLESLAGGKVEEDSYLLSRRASEYSFMTGAIFVGKSAVEALYDKVPSKAKKPKKKRKIK